MAYAKALPARAIISNRRLSDAKYHLRHAANLRRMLLYRAQNNTRIDALNELAAVCLVEWWINLPEAR